jgi:hypothetical protein
LNYRILPNPNYGLTRYYVGFHQKYLYFHKSEPDGEWRELTSSQFQHSLGDWHNVEIAGWGGHLAVYVDGSLEMQYIDQEYLQTGSIAFETLDGSTAQIDDIEVTEPGEEPSVESYEPAAPESSEVPVAVIPPEELPVTCTSYYMTMDYNYDRPGMDYKDYEITLAGDLPEAICSSECSADEFCKAYAFVKSSSHCWLKNGIPDQMPLVGVISGIKVCQ